MGGKYQSAGFSNAHYNQFKINKNVNTEQFTMSIKCLICKEVSYLQTITHSQSTYIYN